MTSISAERASLASLGGGLIRREQWGARHNYGSARTVTEPAKQIFIHITVTNPSAYNSHAAHVRGIEAIGRSRFPNTGISYNRIVLFGVDRAYEAQPMGRRGAHTVNDHRRSTCNRWGAACPGHGGDLTAPSWNNNYTARAYAYGALTQHAVTDSVLDTFARAIADDIKAGFVRRDAKIHGHRCVSSKSCPGDHMWAQMHDLERRVNDYLEDDDVRPSEWNAEDRKAVREALHGSNHFTRYSMISEDKNLGWHLRRIVALLELPVRWADGKDRSAVHTLSWLQRAAASMLESQQGSDAPAILAKLDEFAAADAARDQAVLDAIESIESGDSDAALARLRDLLDAALPDA